MLVHRKIMICTNGYVRIRIRIWETQIHTDRDPDPEHWVPVFCMNIRVGDGGEGETSMYDKSIVFGKCDIRVKEKCLLLFEKVARKNT